MEHCLRRLIFSSVSSLFSLLAWRETFVKSLQCKQAVNKTETGDLGGVRSNLISYEDLLIIAVSEESI